MRSRSARASPRARTIWPHVFRVQPARRAARQRARSRCTMFAGSRTCGQARSPRGSKRLGGARRLSYAAPATCSRTVGVEAERRAVCIERCMHGSEEGAGASSSEAFRAYPTSRSAHVSADLTGCCASGVRTRVCTLADQKRELHDDLELVHLVVLDHALELLDPHGLNVADRLGRALDRLPDRVLEAL